MAPPVHEEFVPFRVSVAAPPIPPPLNRMPWIVTFESTVGVPELICTVSPPKGTVPADQFPGVFHEPLPPGQTTCARMHDNATSGANTTQNLAGDQTHMGKLA